MSRLLPDRVSATLCSGALLLSGLAVEGTVLYEESFENDAGGFIPSGVAPSWEHGTPSNGPGVSYSGTKCWATSLSGTYNTSENGYITSPAIDLSAHGGNPFVLSWQQFVQTESKFDFVSVEVSSDGGGTWQRVYGEATGTVNSDWTHQFALLDSGTATSNFRMRFRLRSDSSVGGAGFYLDTIRIMDLSPRLVYAEDFEPAAGSSPDPGGFTAMGNSNSWELGEATTGPGGAHSGNYLWATGLGGHYQPNEESVLLSPTIDLSAHTGNCFLLSWWQFLSTERNFDLAAVEARPSPTSPWITVYGPVSGLASDRWMRQATLLGPEFATASMQFRFTLSADTAFENLGFYLDDVAVHTFLRTSTPFLTWSDPADIIAGTPLGDLQLNATADVPGTVSYNPPAGTTLPPGRHTLTAVFMPDDLLRFLPVTTTATITVSDYPSYATWSAFPPGTPAAETSPLGDFDGDGCTNFCEYAFGSDALTTDFIAPLPITVESGGETYPGFELMVRADPSLTYLLEATLTLLDWDSSPLAFDGTSWSLAGTLVLHSANQTSPGLWTLKVRESAPLGTHTKSFYRARVEASQP